MDIDIGYLKTVSVFILQGAGISLKVYAITIIFAVPLGVLCAIGKISGFRLLKWILGAYTWIFRGTPLLLQLFFVYYGLPVFGIEFSSEEAAYLTFVVNYGAYFTEIFRAGIQSIEKGQYEAAKALGMSYWQTMRRIILPQAFKVILPPTGNEAVTLIKDTALCSALAIPDILRNAKVTVSREVSVEGYIIAAIIYLILTLVIINAFKYFEKRFAYYD